MAMLFEQIFMDIYLLWFTSITLWKTVVSALLTHHSLPLNCWYDNYEERSCSLTSSYGLMVYPAGIALTMRWYAAFWYQEAVGIVARFPPNWISGDVSQVIYELINQILGKYVFGLRVK